MKMITYLLELIDTQWDVNVKDCLVVMAAYLELIDTQWDVNDKRKQPGYWLGKELIDTQWDVNKGCGLLIIKG